MKKIHDTGAVMPISYLGSLWVAIPQETKTFMELNEKTVLQGITTVIEGRPCVVFRKHE